MEGQRENIENPLIKDLFVYPSIEEEAGEIERVAQLYAPRDETAFVQKFLESAEKKQLINLSEDIWSKLENSDSFAIERGGWEEVEKHANNYERNWKDLKLKIEQRQKVDAPIILKYNDTFYLVSGNTRLMVARALGEIPKVLVVEMKS